MLIDIIKAKIRESIKSQNLKPPSKSKINVEYPKYKKFGDYATNIALSLSKRCKEEPMALAKKLATFLNSDPLFKEVYAEKPGFINFRISHKFLRQSLKDIIQQKEKFGSTRQKRKKKVLLEFVSANPTGPLNVVNARAGALGDSLANIFSFLGYYVEKEYYINDTGNQVELLVESIECELNKLDNIEVEELEDGYKGEYIVNIAKNILEREGTIFFNLPKKERYDKIEKYAVSSILANQKKTLESFKVYFDNWISESELRQKGCVEDILTYLSETGNIFDKDGAVWLCSSKFGDVKDRVIMRTDGTVTYLVPDLAYHITKYKRGFDKIIDILGPDHHGHISKLKAGITILGYKASTLSFILLQQVNLLIDNKKIKMSKREGNIITLRQLISKVGTDAARFFFLMRKFNTPLDFDIELAKKKSSENPVFYVQYAHARICSIESVSRAKRIQMSRFNQEYLKRLNHDIELDIIRHLIKFPELIVHIGATYDINLLTTYLIELASLFHSFYQKFRVINTRYRELTLARLYLCKATKIVLENGLNLLGISAPPKM
ncbi:MAG: arginine--tRNA ligase [Candidatus Cloacimonadota bacterium]|nr:arginine--tRNA ligase [Candidatus Cloacimonadota bacterium]